MQREQLGLALGPLFLIILLLLPPLPGSDHVTQTLGINPLSISIALGVLLWTATWWITECVPLGLAALIPPIVFGFVGIVDWKTSLMLFMHPIVWIFMAGFVFTKAFQKWGLDKRIALKLALLYKGDDPKLSAFFSVALPAFLLTFTGSITAATSIVFPIAIAYLTALGSQKDTKFDEALLGFLITYPASNTASTVIAAPIASSISITAGINPLPAVIATALACSISSALPSTTPPMAIVYGSKKIKLINMFKVGMIADTLRLIVLLITIPYLSGVLLELKGLPLYIGGR